MNPKLGNFCIFLLSLLWIRSCSKDIYVTPNRTCGKSCTGDLINPYDNLLYALKNASQTTSATSIILLGNSSAEHFVLKRELNQSGSTTALYTFTPPIKATLEDVEIRPLFCDDAIVKTNQSLLNKCVNRTQTVTIVFKPFEMTWTIGKRLYVQNIVFDLTESSQSVNASADCAQLRKRCCNTATFSGGINCDPKFYARQPTNSSNTYNFIELSSKNTTGKQLFFDYVTLKNFRDKSIKNFIQTNGNGSFDLTIQNSKIDDVTFGQGLISHIGTGKETLDSSFRFVNFKFKKYNYWNREEETNFSSWKEGYLLWGSNNFKGTITIINGDFIDINSASMYTCEVNTSITSNYLRNYTTSRSDIWSRYDNRKSTQESSLIYLDRLDGDLRIKTSTFEKIIGSYGSVIQIKDCSNSTSYTFLDNVFDNNFGMQGFANMIIATTNKAIGQAAKCPAVQIENCSFVNSKGCPGSYGNVGFICYWDTTPSNNSGLETYSRIVSAYAGVGDKIFNIPQIQIIFSNFQNNLIPISNSLAIVGSYSTSLVHNKFEDNGGTTAEIILYSLNNSNFLEKKPNQYYISKDYDWKSYYSSVYFGQSTAVYFDRILKLESSKNIFLSNWGPWEGSQVLAVGITIRNWIPFRSGYLSFKEDIFKDHSGIPSNVAEYLVDFGIILKENAYMPPLMAISFDPKGSFEFNGKPIEPFIIIDSIKFSNNILSFDFDRGCQYNSYQVARICYIMENNKRYLTGLIKFLSESELREADNIESLIMSQRDEISFAMVDTKILNNTVLSQGCLFSTLWAENYMLDNLTIKDNTINPFGSSFKESADYSEPLLDSALQNMNGIFCGFKRKTLKTDGRILFTATDLKITDNIGTIFNLYPYESNVLSLFNSIFINNTSPYGSIVNEFEGSKVYSKNNIFIENNNPIGIFFVTSIDTSHESISNAYLSNNGNHASLAYINDKARAIEVLAGFYWNTVKPKFLTFFDKITPQGGLFLLESAEVSFVLSEFIKNDAYAGFIVSHKSTISFDLTKITDHQISGNSIIGNMYSSILNMRKIKITNISLSCLPNFDAAAAIIILEKTKFYAEKLEISETFSPNQGTFLLGTKIEGFMKGIKFDQFLTLNGGSLMRLDFSNVRIENLTCNNTTSLFKLSETSLTLQYTVIQNLQLSAESRFLINMIDTTLNIIKFKYLGSSDSGDYSTLITGNNNNVKIIQAQFFRAVNGASKIFELTNSGSFISINSKFYFATSHSQTMVFDLLSSNEVKILGCIFVLAGQVLQANNIFNSLYFAGNTIITNPEGENVKIIGGSATYILDNYFLHHDNRQIITSIPESQVYFLNSLSNTHIKDNIFTSLYGSKGVVKVQALTYPYNITILRNLFINNTGSNGGAIHLDASLSFIPDQTPTAMVEDSIFILNKAINANAQELKGKGGAIYQTTSSSTKQIASIKSSLFIMNSAETIGGALFFDFMPPKFEFDTRFVENYANRPNHIGSYPVRLAFFETQPQESEPYVPSFSQRQSIPTDNLKEIIWENIPSGIQVNRTYIFGLVDIFGQLVYDDSSSSLELYPEGLTKETRYRFSSILSVEARNGLYLFSNVAFAHKIDEYYNVTFTSSAIQDQRKIPLDIPVTSKSSLVVRVHFRECVRGEIVLKEEDNTICRECQPGLWQISLQNNALACKPCNDRSTLCLGGDNVGPKKGYWRLNKTADIVLACPINSSCLGNEIKDQKDSILLDPTGQCQYGYQGNLCSNCMLNWAKTANGSCISCQRDAWSYIKIFLALSIQVALIIFGFKGIEGLCKGYSESKVIKLNSAILIRVLINYLQLISLVSKIPITWPSIIQNISAVTLELASLNIDIFAIECIFNSEEVFGLRIVFVKLLLEIAGSLFLGLLSMIFWIQYFTIKRHLFFRNKQFFSNVLSTFIIICFMMQPSAIQSSFSFFKCTNLYREDTPIRYFSKDYDLKCWEGHHQYWTLGLGLPFLVIWSFFLPFLVFYLIRKNKNKLNVLEISQKYSFLYGGYNHSQYYWEFIIIIRKFVFIALILSASLYSIDLEIYVSIFLISLFYSIQSAYRPFSDPKMNFLEQSSLLGALIINFSGLYFHFFESTWLALDYTVIVIALIGNLVFFVAFVWLCLQSQFDKLNRNSKIYIIMSKISKNVCCCLETVPYERFPSKPQTTIEPQETQTLQTKRFTSEIKSERDELISTKRILTKDNFLRKVNSGITIELAGKDEMASEKILSTKNLLSPKTPGDYSIFEELSINQEQDENVEKPNLASPRTFVRMNRNILTHHLQSVSKAEPAKTFHVLPKLIPEENLESQKDPESLPNFDDLSINQEKTENNQNIIPLSSNINSHKISPNPEDNTTLKKNIM